MLANGKRYKVDKRGVKTMPCRIPVSKGLDCE